MQTLTLSRKGWPKTAPAPGPIFVLTVDPPAPARAAPIEHRRKLTAPILHDVAVMRDLVLGAFLGPQHFREDDGTYVAPYTIENTRDAFPQHLEALRECPTDNGEAGRLPSAYVAALAKGTTRVIASETRPKKKSSVPLGPLAFQDARIVREVGLLAPEHQHWIRYAYADSTAWDDESGATVALWARYEPQLGKVLAKTRKAAQGLAHLAVQNAKRVINTDGKVLHTPGRVRELLGVTEANWDKHWSARWQALNEAAAAMDRDALAALCKRLQGFNFVLLDRGL